MFLLLERIYYELLMFDAEGKGWPSLGDFTMDGKVNWLLKKINLTEKL